MEKTRTYATHPAAFVNQPVAAPHQAFLPIGSEVPLVKKSSFPPGEAKSGNHKLLPFIGRFRPVTFGRILSAPTRQSWLKIYEFPMAVRFLASPEGKLDFLTIGTSEPIGKKD